MLSARYSRLIVLIFKLLLYAKATPQQILVLRAIFSRNNWLPLMNDCVQEAEAPLAREIVCAAKEAEDDERKGTSKCCAKRGGRK